MVSPRDPHGPPPPPNRPPLTRLIYVSASRLAPDPAHAAAELDGILAVSRRNNERDGVTGALLFSPWGFAQALEGPPRAVEATLARIAADPRHVEVAVLARGPARVRAFARWAMAAAAADADADALAMLARRTGDAPRPEDAAQRPAAPEAETGPALVALMRRALLAAAHGERVA